MQNMLNVTFDPTSAGTIKWTHMQKSDDVLCVDFMLDVGRLSPGVCSPYRRTLFDFLYNQTHHLDDAPKGTFAPGGSSDMGSIYDEYAEEHERLMARLTNIDKLRIWAGTKANDVCSLRWLCNVLVSSGYSGSVYFMEAPLLEDSLTGRCEVTSWAYLEPASLSDYVSLERELSAEELNDYASEWRSLVAEDLMLRSVIEGELRSVGEDFFDPVLLALFPDEPVKMAAVVGKALTGPMRYHNDLAIAWRINRLIESGEVGVVDDPEPWNLMKRILRRRVAL